MSFLGRIFRKKVRRGDKDFVNPVTTELHSHLIPGIDDGVGTVEESIQTLKALESFGYRKIITTPHIMGDFYKNSPGNILPGLEKVRAAVKENNLSITVEAAAEYMVDELMREKIEQKNLLTFGGSCVLIELPVTEEPAQFKEILFLLQMNGYQPVLAHPERYHFWHHSTETLEALKDSGVWLQLNILSLIGYYSPRVQKAAETLIDKKLVDLVGSDAHGPRHMAPLVAALSSYYYQKACALPLRNNSL